MTGIARPVALDRPAIVAPAQDSPVAFFLLVFALSVPFAVLGATTGWQLAPGIPVSALGFVCPVAAAAILSERRGGSAAVRALLKRTLDFARIGSKWWYAPILLLMPVITVTSYLLLPSTGTAHIAPHFGFAATPLMFVVFLVAALGEELGWSGYVLDPLQSRWGALRAALILGVVWAAWHIVAMVQAGQGPTWIAWGCADMVATRVLMVWIYDNTGRSVFAVALYHAGANLSVKSFFPGGSYQGERIITVLLVAAAALVAVVAGRAALHRHSHDGRVPRRVEEESR